jgi:ketosteroid isomerase-like protein
MSNSENNAALITHFYEAFQRGAAAEMAACYHHDVVFSDPAFGELRGKQVGAMWAMLLERAEGDLDVTFSNVSADGDRGSAHWEAKYHFSQTGRPVHNRVDAKFRFKEGLIIEHRDSFSMRDWLSMALGSYAGIPPLDRLFAKVVRKKVNAALDDYRSSEN